MLMVLSPSKTLNYDSEHGIKKHTQPELLEQSERLIGVLRSYSETKLAALMKLSPKLAALNVQRYSDFSTPFTSYNARQALLAFKGDVYESIEAHKYSTKEWDYAQEHLRMLSGLYGVLRPLDLMQPYRLEMGTKLPTKQGKNLYEFWDDQITNQLNAALKESGSNVLVNLASNEYFKAVNPEVLNGRIVTIDFKEKRGNKLQTIGLFAKKARGAMANYAIRNAAKDVKVLKKFTVSGYRFDEALSNNETFTFLR